MNHTPSTPSSANHSVTRYILLAGAMAGTLDAIGAMVVYQVEPVPVFKYIASGLLGKSAFEGGTEMVVVGILIHFAIAFSWTIFFFLVFPKLKLSQLNKIITVILYGILIWVIMNLVVLPMTQITTGEFSLIPALKGTAILIVAVSLPICLLAYRYYQNRLITGRT